MGDRRKAYVVGSQADLRVPFTEVHQEGANPPVRLYDTSGPQGLAPEVGLPPLRGPWVHARADIDHYPGRAPTLRDDGRASERAGEAGAEPFPGDGAQRPRLRAAAGKRVTQMH